MSKTKYTAAEKRAYYRGQGYQIAKSGGKIDCRNDKTKASCRAGVNSAKSGKGVKK